MCIGALIAHLEPDHWAVDAVGAPHVGERTEKQLIAAFCDKIAELKPFFHAAAVQQTIEWLDHHGIPYKDLCFMREKDQVGADIYIDDAPHIRTVAQP